MSQHYRFAYNDLRRRVFERTDEIRSALASEPEAYLSWLWHGCPQSAAAPVEGLTARSFSHQGQPAVLIALPPPQQTPEAYFVLILFGKEGPDIYALEKTESVFFPEGTVLGRLYADRHENLGPGCAPDPDEFLKLALKDESGETP
jgi:hypothetical protein